MLKVKLLHPDAQLPTVVHAGSDIGFDLYSIEDAVLYPGVPTRIRTGIAVEGPPGVGFLLGDRSSMAAKGVTYMGGRIDAGYRGELLICLVNVNQPEYSLRTSYAGKGALPGLEKTDVSVRISKGDKIAQMSPFEARTNLQIVAVSELESTARNTNGFGSSGQ